MKASGRAALLLVLLLAPLQPAVAGDWPQWRGPRRDGHAAADEPLPDQLPAGWTPRWTRPVGPGFASPVVVGDTVYLAEKKGDQETLIARSTRDGAPRWETAYGTAEGDEWGEGPRCTPLVDLPLVFVQSMRGEFACLDAATGRRRWGVSFERDYGVAYVGGSDSTDAASRRRGHNGAPLVLGNRVYVAVGSPKGATVVCFDKASGKEQWRAGEDETAYAALMPVRFAGREQVIGYVAGGLRGWDAEDGKLLWQVPLRSHANRHAVTPVIHEDTVTISSHTLGTRAFRLEPSGDGVSASPAWSNPALKTSLATPVRVGGHLYGQGPDRNLVCVDAATGKVVWSRRGFGDQPLVGYTAVIAAGPRLLAQVEDGQMVLVEASPEGYRELGREQVCGKTWSHPALAGGRVYLRDREQLYAFDLRSTAP